jgi:hypothetical protein
MPCQTPGVLAAFGGSRSLDDARRILREAAANPDEKAALRSLLKEICLLIAPEDDGDEVDLIEDEDEAEEKEIALAVRGMVLELKRRRR